MIYEALERIEKAGFRVRECNGLLDVDPSDRLNDAQWNWIDRNQDALIRQVKAMRHDAIRSIITLFQADVISISETMHDKRLHRR